LITRSVALFLNSNVRASPGGNVPQFLKRPAKTFQNKNAEVFQANPARTLPAKCRGKSVNLFLLSLAVLFLSSSAAASPSKCAAVCLTSSARMCPSRSAARCQDSSANRCQDNSAKQLSQHMANNTSLNYLISLDIEGDLTLLASVQEKIFMYLKE